MMHIEIYNVCRIIIFFSCKKTRIFKYNINSNFWLQKNVQRPCLKWLDMLYLLCMLLVKKSEKTPEDNKKNTKTGEMIFAKKNKCNNTFSLFLLYYFPVLLTFFPCLIYRVFPALLNFHVVVLQRTGEIPVINP